ncbi:hypothetical protein JTE90_002287 [Oedothorax gibbosus]|uniref:Uncharacterized protein n=1 Tax=Oedothorax gibbosus TaxID=931172 RepID=A0AAV6U918_9ARAC|nr:hypothetical protein JTE90_002287 [Oedothorax gibbosus]
MLDSPRLAWSFEMCGGLCERIQAITHSGHRKQPRRYFQKLLSVLFLSLVKSCERRLTNVSDWSWNGDGRFCSSPMKDNGKGVRATFYG